MQAIILCGGQGTRLRSVIGEKQKTMTEVDNEPFLVDVIKYLKGYKITNVIFATGYKSDEVRNYFGNKYFFGVEVNYAEEKEKEKKEDNKKKNLNSKPILLKNYSNDNISYSQELDNIFKLESIRNKKEINNSYIMNKYDIISNRNNESTFINDLKLLFKNKKKNSLYKSNQKNQNKKAVLEKFNGKLKQKKKHNKHKSLNSSFDGNKIYKNIYNINDIYYNCNNFYSLIIDKKNTKNKLKNAINNLENTIKLFNNIQKKNKKECKKIIDYNNLIINNIEKKKKKINNSILDDDHNYDYDNECSDIINESLEINEEIITIRNYSDIINKYNKLLNEIIVDHYHLNEKIEEDKNAYNKYCKELEIKYIIIEINSNIVKQVLERIKDLYL